MTLAHARIARPIGDGGGRSIGWWGAALGIFTIAHLVGGLLVAAVYLRAYTEVWPPFSGPAPGMILTTVAVLLTVAAAAAVAITNARIRRGHAPSALLLLVATVLALGAAGVRGSQTIFSGWPVTEHAYWSIRWALGGLDVVLLASLAGVTGMGAWHAQRQVFRLGAHAEMEVIGLWAWATAAFVAASWLVFGFATGWLG